MVGGWFCIAQIALIKRRSTINVQRSPGRTVDVQIIMLVYIFYKQPIFRQLCDYNEVMRLPVFFFIIIYYYTPVDDDDINCTCVVIENIILSLIV